MTYHRPCDITEKSSSCVNPHSQVLSRAMLTFAPPARLVPLPTPPLLSRPITIRRQPPHATTLSPQPVPLSAARLPPLPPHETLMPLLYPPASLLLIHRLSNSLPLPHRLIALSLLIILPQLMSSTRTNLTACSALRSRTRHSARLARPINMHTALTLVTATGNLAGLFIAYIAPCMGALMVLLSQVAFYLLRRLRFESGRRVYRCDPKQYTDVVRACALTSCCVLGVTFDFLPVLLAALALFAACTFWLIKWVFVPRSATVF